VLAVGAGICPVARLLAELFDEILEFVALSLRLLNAIINPFVHRAVTKNAFEKRIDGANIDPPKQRNAQRTQHNGKESPALAQGYPDRAKTVGHRDGTAIGFGVSRCS